MRVVVCVCVDDEYEEEEQERVEEADAYNDSDDAWDEDFPQDDVDLEEPVGSPETAEAVAMTEMENASSEMESAARSFMDATKLVDSFQWLEWVLSTVCNL